MTNNTWSPILGLIMVGFFVYGIVIIFLALKNGSLLIPMRGSRAVPVTRQLNPVAFWFYFSVTIVGILLCVFFAFSFLGW